MHTAIILLGSNIDSEQNLQRAGQALEKACKLQKISNIWLTKAIGSIGPDFLNQAIRIETQLEQKDLKYLVLRRIEKDLGRVRVKDKYAARTIDLDIIVFDDQVVDSGVWKQCFITAPVSDLLPNLQQSDNTKTLQEVAADLQRSGLVKIFNKSADN